MPLHVEQEKLLDILPNKVHYCLEEQKYCLKTNETFSQNYSILISNK